MFLLNFCMVVSFLLVFSCFQLLFLIDVRLFLGSVFNVVFCFVLFF